MKVAYRALASLVLVLVVLQAADLAFGLFGVGAWVEDGHALTKSAVQDNSSGITGEAGLALHSIIGQMLIPLVAVVLFVISFFARIEGGVRWAGLILGDVVLQVLLAFVSFGVPTVGMLHGINAFVLFWLAMMAAAAATRSLRQDVSAAAPTAGA